MQSNTHWQNGRAPSSKTQSAAAVTSAGWSRSIESIKEECCQGWPYSARNKRYYKGASKGKASAAAAARRLSPSFSFGAGFFDRAMGSA
jgi:hypothetical protein